MVNWTHHAGDEIPVLVSVPKLRQNPQGVSVHIVPSSVWLKPTEEFERPQGIEVSFGNVRDCPNRATVLEDELSEFVDLLTPTDPPGKLSPVLTDGKGDDPRLRKGLTSSCGEVASDLPRQMVQDGSHIVDSISDSERQRRRQLLLEENPYLAFASIQITFESAGIRVSFTEGSDFGLDRLDFRLRPLELKNKPLLVLDDRPPPEESTSQYEITLGGSSERDRQKRLEDWQYFVTHKLVDGLKNLQSQPVERRSALIERYRQGRLHLNLRMRGRRRDSIPEEYFVLLKYSQSCFQDFEPNSRRERRGRRNSQLRDGTVRKEHGAVLVCTPEIVQPPQFGVLIPLPSLLAVRLESSK
jgi:Tfp pilus assembly protein PilZ